MPAKPLSDLRSEWGFHVDTHWRVVEELDEEHPADLADIAVFDPEQIEVGVPEYMKALRRVDKRTWHQRMVDALTQWYLEFFEESEYDLMLREVDYNHTEYSSPGKDDIYYRKGMNKGDIDFALVSFGDGEVFVDAFEAKTSVDSLGDAMDQLERIRRSHDNVERKIGLETEVESTTILPEDALDLMEQMGSEYSIPRRYRGDFYTTADRMESLEEDPTYREWAEAFLSNPEFSLDYDGLIEEERQEEFLR
ncbi:MAG: hypothetical protein ABEI58_02690 [Candidatus Nanohaloarchaea archaeon]